MKVMPKCIKCSKRTGATINGLCFTCSEGWDYEKVRFKHVKGYAPEPEDFSEWVFSEEKFNARLLPFTPCRIGKNPCTCNSKKDCKFL